jgi:hypothetical protein
MNLNEQNEEFDMNLIGVDKMVTVQAYTNRDIYLNINYNTQIINSLKKLNYYNLAESVPRTLHAFKIKKLNILIAASLENEFNNIIRAQTINELLNLIEESEDYIAYQSRLQNRVERSDLLMVYINQIDENIFDFYNELTLEELNILGY